MKTTIIILFSIISNSILAGSHLNPKIFFGGPTITTGTINGSPFCQGESFVLPYTISGTYTAGNVFTAQLSNSVGSFASPITIGTITSVSAGNINCTIPGGALTGSGYMVRVISSTPSVTGSNSTAFTVNAIPTPMANNTGPYCEGSTIQLNSPAGSATDDWSGPNGYNGNNIQNPTIPNSTIAMSGVYTVTVTNAAGCSATAITTVTINALPIPTANNTGPYCPGATIQLNSPTGSATDDWMGPNSYVGNNIQNPTIPNCTIAMDGIYTVTVTNMAGCSATATTTVIVTNCSGIEDEIILNADVYPNPTQDWITISLNDKMIGEATVSIINITGQMIYSTIPKQEKQTISFHDLGLKSGLYFIEIVYKGRSKVVRIVKN